jgi:hypothetical protein
MIESDPYEKYHLKTGKHRSHTLKELNSMNQCGYLKWMLTNSKACKDVDDDHIVKKGLLQWASTTGQEVPQAETTAETPSAAGPSTAAPVDNAESRRFKNEAGIWITISGFDIIGLFNITEQ